MRAETWITLFVGIATVLVGVATIVAIVRGPIIALRIQRKLDDERQEKDRKLWIFKTLMAYRVTRLSPQFVQALNLIDIEFTGPSEKSIRDAWKELQDHYTDWGRKTTAEREAAGTTLEERANDLLAEMLVKMGSSLGYTFDKVYVKKASYYPEGLGNMELEQHALRKGLLKVLAGEAWLPVAVFQQTFAPLNEPEKAQHIHSVSQQPGPRALL
jgi:hypothetical protein